MVPVKKTDSNSTFHFFQDFTSKFQDFYRTFDKIPGLSRAFMELCK